MTRRDYFHWSRLSNGDRLRLLLAMAFLPCVSVLLRLRGVVRTRTLLERMSQVAEFAEVRELDLAFAHRLSWLAAVAGRRGPLHSTCLPQALFVHWLLRRRGFDSALRIGVAKSGSDLDAHAWVELAGEALGEPSLRHAAFPDRSWRPALRS